MPLCKIKFKQFVLNTYTSYLCVYGMWHETGEFKQHNKCGTFPYMPTCQVPVNLIISVVGTYMPTCQVPIKWAPFAVYHFLECRCHVNNPWCQLPSCQIMKKLSKRWKSHRTFLIKLVALPSYPVLYNDLL